MQNVFISGASSGIGWATACHLADHGYRVFGTTRSLSKRADLVEQARQRYRDRLEFKTMDVTSDDSVSQTVQEVIRQAGGIDVLICNAGWGVFGSIEEMPMEYAIKQFDTNVFGTLRLLKAVIPHMRAKRSGRIVLLSSIGGVICIPYQAHYSASKYAIEALTEGLRQELRGFGIKVCAIRPGDIKTEFNDATYSCLPENSMYASWSSKCWQTIDANMRNAPPASLVAKVIRRALQARNPRAFYTAADPFTALTPILTPLMTPTLKEKVVRLFYGIDFK